MIDLSPLSDIAMIPNLIAAGVPATAAPASPTHAVHAIGRRPE